MTGRRLFVIGGACAVAGGLLWLVKSVSILASGYQPPVMFELAMPLFGVAVTVLPAGGRARVAHSLGWAAAVSGCVALLSELLGDAWNAAIVASTVATLAGLLVAGLSSPTRRRGSVAWVALLIGAGTVPALVVVGGALALVDERLIEVPQAMVGCLWIWLGGTLLTVPAPRS